MFPGRGVSLRGLGYSRWIKGQLYWSKWPRSQKAPRTAREKDTRDLFAVASRVTLYMSAAEQAFARDLAKESKLLPRDFLMIALFNRVGTIVRRDGSKVFSVPAMQDVSGLLDALWQLKGGILIRDETWWTGLPAGQPFDVLRMSPEGLPEWASGGGGDGGGVPFMQPPLLKPTAAGATINPGFFNGLPIWPTSATVLTGLDFYATAAGAGRQVVAGVYQGSGLTMSGTTLMGQSTAQAVVTGKNHVPFTAPVNLAADQFAWLGILVISGSGNVQLMTADVTRNSYMFFSHASPALPGTAPASTAGTGATQFTWWAT